LPQGSVVVRVPAEHAVPDEVIAPVSCATATAIAACQIQGLKPLAILCDPVGVTGRSSGATQKAEEAFANLSNVQNQLTPTGSHEIARGFNPWHPVVVVFGAGLVGLSACAELTTHELTAIIACDIDDTRLSLAKRFGATHTAKPGELVELARSLSEGRGADFSLEASGSPSAIALSLEVLRVGGLAAWVGAVSPTAPVPVNPETVVRKCLKLVGVHNYAPWHLQHAVNFLTHNHARFPFAELVSKTFPLEEVDAAFQYAETERPVRVSVECNSSARPV
jgi:alcohol dehydrogenase